MVANLINLTINNKRISVPKGTTVQKAAGMAGYFIPVFCYDPELSVYGACRICVVEIIGMRNLAASCVTEAVEGMEVLTDSETVLEARRTILELILANHPMDCLTCDKTGDCRLQDYCFRYGVKGVDFSGQKANYLIEEDNPYIIRDMNKCILCGKCVRTCSQIRERSVIDFINRGFATKVAPAMDTSLGGSDCVYCNRCVSVCPVGALMSKPMAGKARVWEIKKETVVCSFCESGCTFQLNKKNNKVIGVSAGTSGTGRPLCLKGRLGMELLYCEQPETPQIKKGEGFEEASWEEALGLKGLLDKIKTLEDKQS
ncbi:MAG: 4Fe-4S dicluster domain-containing protein [Peptococcaceae bacterium]|nr:4Fe-4S dicluster domain-containing protein [Peptococcaceae bacterium]